MTEPMQPAPPSSDWRAERLARLRTLILLADPAVVEEVKWRKPTNPDGVLAWSHDGLICTGETYKDKVKLTFARGAAAQRAGPSTSTRRPRWTRPHFSR